MSGPSFTSIWSKTRSLVVPTISAFLCFVFVVIGPLNHLGGDYSFLVYTSLLLFFFPTGKVIAQLEATVFGITGAVIGLLWSCACLAIAAYCGRVYGPDCDASRAVLGLGLGILSLICGFLRSAYPSLTAASRIALFFPIFLLTANPRLTSMKWSYFTNQFLVACFAAAFSLIPTLLISYRSSSPRLGHIVLDTLRITSELLPLSLLSVLDRERDSESEPNAIHSQQEKLARTLKSQVTQVQPVYDTSILEILHGRSAPTALKDLVESLKRLQRNPLLGPTSRSPGDRIRAALDRTYENVNSAPISVDAKASQRSINGSIQAAPTDGRVSNEVSRRSLEARHRRSRSSWSQPRPMVTMASDRLVQAILSALNVSANELADAYDWQDQDRRNTGESLKQVKDDLELALAEQHRKLTSLLDGMDGSNDVPSDSSTRHLPETLAKGYPLDHYHERDHFRLAFYMTALLDLAKDVLDLVNVTITIVSRAESQKRWFLPNIPWLSLEKLGGGQSPASRDELEAAGDEAANEEDESAMRPTEKVFEEADYVTSYMRGPRQTFPADTIPQRLKQTWKRGWDHRRVIAGRIVLSRLLHYLRHSPHVLFSIKLAGGISLLALPAFLQPGSAGRAYYGGTRGAWTVISYMYVLEVHTGATMKVGFFRLLGTFVGALAGYVFTLIAHNNPYALVTLATAASVPLSYLILFTKYPPIGVVAGITLPPLLFISYLDLAEGQTNWHLAWTRFVDITIGIAAAVFVGSFVWPNHARVRYFRAVSTTIHCGMEYYLHMSRDLLRPSLVYQNNTKEYNKLEGDVRRYIQTSRTLIDIQRKEMSLLPRPIKLYSEVVDAAERLLETFYEIRILRFSVPRKATVLDALPLRRELISSIMIHLWALSQSFRSRSSLPQYLPSPRIPLEGIMEIVDNLARARRNGDREGKDELAVLYAMAENEALGEVCTILEELVAASRTMFGTSKFLDSSQHLHGFENV